MDRAITICILALLLVQFELSEQKPTRFQTPSSNLELKPHHEQESKEISTLNSTLEPKSLKSRRESIGEPSWESFGTRNKPRVSSKPFVGANIEHRDRRNHKEYETNTRTHEGRRTRRPEQHDETIDDIKEVTERSKTRHGQWRIKEQETNKDQLEDNTTPRVSMNNLKSLYVKNNLPRLIKQSSQERIVRFQANGDHNQEHHIWKPANYELRKPNPSVKFTSRPLFQESTRSTPEIMNEPSVMVNTEIDGPSRNSNIGIGGQGNSPNVKPGLPNGQRNGGLKTNPDFIEKHRLQLISKDVTQITPTVFTPQIQKKIEQIKDDITAIENEEVRDYTDIGREETDHDEDIDRLEQQIDDMMMMERRFEDLGESEDLADDMGLEDKHEIEDENTNMEGKGSQMENKSRERLTKLVRPKREIPDVFEDSVGMINALPLIDLESMVLGQTEETPTSTQGPDETMSDVDNANEKGEEFRTVITFEEKRGPNEKYQDEVTQTTRVTQETTKPTVSVSSMADLMKTSGDNEAQTKISTRTRNSEEIETANTTTMELNNEKLATTVRTVETPIGEITEQKDGKETIAKEQENIPLTSQLNNSEIDSEQLRELQTERSDKKTSEAQIEISTSSLHMETESRTEAALIRNLENDSSTTKDTPTNIEVTPAIFSRSEKDEASEATTIQPTTLQQVETTTSVKEISTKMSVSVKVSVSVSEKIEKVDGKKTVDKVENASSQETTTVNQESDTTISVQSKTTESNESSTSKSTELNKATVPTLDITSTSTEAIETRQNKNDDDEEQKTKIINENAIQERQVGTNVLGLKSEERNSRNKLNDTQFKATELTVEENNKPQISEYDQPIEARKEDPADSKTTDVIVETSSSLFKTEKDLSTQRYQEEVEITTIGVVTKRDALDITEVTTTENMLKESNGTSEISSEAQKSLTGTNETTENRNTTVVDEGKPDQQSDQVATNVNENYLVTKETPIVPETESTTGINYLQETIIGDMSTTKGNTDIVNVLEEKESTENVPTLTTTEAMVEDDSLKMENTTMESSDNTTGGEISTVVTEISLIDKNINESKKFEVNPEKHNITNNQTPTQEQSNIKTEKQEIEIHSSNVENIPEINTNPTESNMKTSNKISDKTVNSETSNNTTSQAGIGFEQKLSNSSESLKNNLPNIEEIKEIQKNKNINNFKLRQRPVYQKPKFRKNQESETVSNDNFTTKVTHKMDETHAHKDMINSKRIIMDKMNAEIVQTLVNDKHRFNVHTKNKINQQKHEQSELLKEKFGIKPVLGLKTKPKIKTDVKTEEPNNNGENNSNSGVEDENEGNQETAQENSETLTDSNESETDENNEDNPTSIKERLTKLREEKIKNRYLTTVQKHRQNERIQISKSNDIKNRINAMIDRQNADELGSSRSKFTNLQRLSESNGGKIKYNPIRTVKTDIKIPIDKLWAEDSNSNYERNPEVANANERNANSFKPTTSRSYNRKSTTQSLYSSLMAEKKPQPRVPFRPSSRRTSEKPELELENTENRRIDEGRPEYGPEENPSEPISEAIDRPVVSTSKHYIKLNNRNIQNIPFATKHTRPSSNNLRKTKLAQFEPENSEIEEDRSEYGEENSNPSATISGVLDTPNTPTIKNQRNPLNRRVQNIPVERENIKTKNQMRPTIKPIRTSPNRFSNIKKVSHLEKLEKEPKSKPEVDIELKSLKSTESLEDIYEENVEPTSSRVETFDYDSVTPNAFINSNERRPEPLQNQIVRNEDVNESSKLNNNDRSTSYLKRVNNQRQNTFGNNLNPRLLKLLSREKRSR